MQYSFLIVTADRHSEVRRLIDSIYDQQIPKGLECDILVLDNASKLPVRVSVGGESQICRTRVIRTEQKLGVPEARNRLGREALGEYLIYIDDDAFIPERDFVAKLVEYLNGCDREKLAAVACNIIEYYKPWKKNYYPFSRRRLKKGLNVTRPLKCTRFLGTTHILRKSIFLQLKGYDEKLFFWWEEMDLSYRILNSGYEIHYNPDLLVLHESSAVRSIDKRKGDFYFLRNKIYLNFKYLPVPYRFTSSLIWITVCLMNTRKLTLIIRAILKARKLLRHESRCILSKQSLRYIREHHGRLYF